MNLQPAIVLLLWLRAAPSFVSQRGRYAGNAGRLRVPTSSPTLPELKP